MVQRVVRRFAGQRLMAARDEGGSRGNARWWNGTSGRSPGNA